MNLIPIVEKIIEKKIIEDENFIKFTFYELRVKENLSEEDMYGFIAFAKNKLENLNYKTYRTRQKYEYNYKTDIVKDNELLVAIKKQSETGKK